MKKRVRKAVFPAAGLGTRFLPATKAQPKEMLPLVDKPIIQYVVEEAVASGIEHVAIGLDHILFVIGLVLLGGTLLTLFAIAISLKTTLITSGVTILFGTPLAYVLARRRFRFRRALDTLVDLPIVLPPAVAGVALLIAFGRQGIIGAWLSGLGIQIAFTQTAVIMAQTFVAAPFYIKAASLGFASVDAELEQAAAIDGAGSWQAFRHITVPLAWAAMLSGAVMTWARALG